MRTVVLAYGEVGWAGLDELLRLGAEVPLVVSHRDAPGERIWFRSVAERAREAGVPVLLPDDVNATEARRAIAAAAPDLLLSIYFRQMISPAVLSLARVAALNLHGSLLPRYRGRAPVNWVLVHGERETGVTLHEMDEKPDHGPIVAQRRVAIDRDDTALSLTRKLAAAGRALLRDAYPRLVAGTAERRPQDHAGATYFGRRTPADGRIDWRRDAESIRNLVRAVTDPWPGAFTSARGERLFVWRAEVRPAEAPLAPGEVARVSGGEVLVATGRDWLELLEVSRPGGAHESGGAWARRERLAPGERLGAEP